MGESDSELLPRAVAGDRDALAILLERHTPAVRTRLHSAIPSRWQSVLSMDDVLQQTYADAFLDVDRFDPAGSGTFATWLKTLANRNLIDAIRCLEAEKRGGDRQRVEAAPGSNDPLAALCEQIGLTATTPSRTARRGEASAELRRAIQRLPAIQRQVVQAYDLDGHEAVQIAKEIERSVGAVYMLRARAHRRLRELLGSASDYLSSGG